MATSSCTSREILRAFGVVCLSVWLLSGCAGGVLTPNYAGKVIETNYQISIQAEQGSGVFVTDDVRIDYQYIKSGDTIKIQGFVRFADSMDMNFNYIDYFNLGALFADANGRILTSAALTSASWVNLSLAGRQMQFAKEIAIPGDVVLMAFTYTGQASYGGGGGAGGDSTQFWQYPVGG